MSHISLVIEERTADIGGFLVGRILPFRRKRMVGPFIFIDHFGPVEIDEKKRPDVLPHPHIGLSTLTFLLQGSMLHQDSLGNVVEITPGSVNWMTAGKGIVHSERMSAHMIKNRSCLHGLQIWVALPREFEQIDPTFTHIPEEKIPEWEENDLLYRLVAGEIPGKKSPVPVFSPLYMLSIENPTDRPVEINPELFGETGLYILEGSAEVDGQTFGSRQMPVFPDESPVVLSLGPHTHVFLFGGEAFPETRYIDWNFVSSDQRIINAARERWIRQEFDKIPTDSKEFVPYPTPTKPK